MSEGKKYDKGKMMMGLLPGPALYEVARVLTFGAKKYDSWNWSKGMKWSRVIDALERHLEKFKRRQDIDDESGLLHIAQVACNALFLTTYQLMNLGEDDRWKPSTEAVNYMKNLQVWLDQAQQQIEEGIPVALSLDDEFKNGQAETLEIKDEVLDKIKKLAKEKGCTINSLILEMLNEMLEKEKE